MKERILVVVACVLSCAVIFCSIIAYKEYRKTNADIEVSSSDIGEKTEEDTSAEEEPTTKVSDETTLKAEETEKNSAEATTVGKKPDKNKTTVKGTETVEKTTEKNIESTTQKSTTEESTTEKIYPVLAESKADMVRLVNSLTSSASQGSYALTRTCYAKDEFVASDMDKLNEIIQKVNPNATFRSAINDYLGVGTTTATIKNGRPTTDVKEEYLLKAMSLTVDDVKNWHQKENKIIVNLGSNRYPTTYQHITNDFITVATIEKFIGGYTTEYEVSGAMMGYGVATLEVTIDDGKLTNLKIYHSVYADVEFETDNRMEGTYATETTYSDIVYS